MIYFLQRSDGNIKIGTTLHFEKRLAQLTAEYGPLKLLGVMDGGRAEEVELHEMFSSDLEGHEWFFPTENLLNYIRQHTNFDVSFPFQLSRRTEVALKAVARSTLTRSIDDVIWQLVQTVHPDIADLAQDKVRRKIVTRLGQIKAEKEKRENRKIPWEEVARECNIAYSTMLRWADGKTRRFDNDTLRKLCLYFDVQPGDIIKYQP